MKGHDLNGWRGGFRRLSPRTLPQRASHPAYDFGAGEGDRMPCFKARRLLGEWGRFSAPAKGAECRSPLQSMPPRSSLGGDSSKTLVARPSPYPARAGPGATRYVCIPCHPVYNSPPRAAPSP
jgi:hypothetical protein